MRNCDLIRRVFSHRLVFPLVPHNGTMPAMNIKVNHATLLNARRGGRSLPVVRLIFPDPVAMAALVLRQLYLVQSRIPSKVRN